jgi:hypothetical protein
VGDYVFDGDDQAIIYYLPGTTGWEATYGGRPTALWNPQIATTDGTFGVGPSGFGFIVVGTTNIPIVIHACTNLTYPDWIPLHHCTLTNGSVYFSDPDWTDHPARFYTIRWP